MFRESLSQPKNTADGATEWSSMLFVLMSNFSLFLLSFSRIHWLCLVSIMGLGQSRVVMWVVMVWR